MNDVVSSSARVALARAARRAPVLELRAAVKAFGTSPWAALPPWPQAFRHRPPVAPGATRRAVDGVDLTIGPAEALGVVGESGCGKSTLARLVVGLVPLTEGQRRWRGLDVTWPGRDEQRALRAKLQLVFARPRSALDPRLRVLDIVGDAPVALRLIHPRQRLEYVALQLNRVGIDPMLMRRFPDDFAPGQQVRIALARALAMRPELLVCDDVLLHLDITERAQWLNLLMDLRPALDIPLLVVGRDMRAVAHVSDRLMLMREGRIVEQGPTAELLDRLDQRRARPAAPE